MAINGIRCVGDDQQWKLEIEKQLAELKQTVAILNIQFNTRNK
jgi:hypothetical protein